jgi:hypothetical protein
MARIVALGVGRVGVTPFTPQPGAAGDSATDGAGATRSWTTSRGSGEVRGLFIAEYGHRRR